MMAVAWWFCAACCQAFSRYVSVGMVARMRAAGWGRRVSVVPPEHGFDASGQAHAAVVAQHLA